MKSKFLECSWIGKQWTFQPKSNEKSFWVNNTMLSKCDMNYGRKMKTEFDFIWFKSANFKNFLTNDNAFSSR